MINIEKMIVVSWRLNDNEDVEDYLFHHKESGAEIHCSPDDKDFAIRVAKMLGGQDIQVSETGDDAPWDIIPEDTVEYREWETPYYVYSEKGKESLIEGDTLWSWGYIPYDTLEIVYRFNIYLHTFLRGKRAGQKAFFIRKKSTKTRREYWCEIKGYPPSPKK